MWGDHLNVHPADARVLERSDETQESMLGGMPLAKKHAFPGEASVKLDAIDASHQPGPVPGLTAMGMTKSMSSSVIQVPG